MTDIFSIPVSPIAKSRRDSVDFGHLTFGQEHTDYMFIARYSSGSWQEARFEPFANLSLSPFALGLHYGQTVFEGMKAFWQDSGQVVVFRPDRHHERFNLSLERMAMPAVPKGLFMQALMQFLELEKAWVPANPGSALYIRPFVVATEPRMGVKISEEYLFLIVASPVGPYYAKPLRVKVETHYTRAAPGGTGFAKCGGNYGGAFLPARLAREEGFDQVLWTDANHHEFLEESGTMNLMFFWEGILRTPPLGETLLDGVTRDSLLTLARDMGIRVDEAPVRWRVLEGALREGRNVEVFGAGTAAVVAPISWVQLQDRGYPCPAGPEARMFVLRDALEAIRLGRQPDVHGWNHAV